MAKQKQTVPANKDVLRWAREQRGYGRKQAAELLGLTEQELAAIEDGNILPTNSLFNKMVQVYKQVESILLLPQPPETAPLPQDFRTVGGASAVPSPDTLLAIREAQRLQHYVSELVADDPELMACANIPQASPLDEIEALAIEERQRFGVSLQAQLSLPARDAFPYWRIRMQDMGVFLLLRKMPWDDCRGFSLLGEDLIPAIVVNSEDSDRARIFTVFHEYAHLMLRNAGVCIHAQDSTPKGRIERWCNRFAAAFLVPENDLRSYVASHFNVTREYEWPLEQIKSLATRYRVSRPVVAIRLQDLELAPPDYYNRHKDRLHCYDRRPEPKEPPKIGRLPGWREKQKLEEVGLAAASAILHAWKGEIADATEAADILNLSLDQLLTLEEHVEVQRSRYVSP